jgi:hypothetical protein
MPFVTTVSICIPFSRNLLMDKQGEGVEWAMSEREADVAA